MIRNRLLMLEYAWRKILLKYSYIQLKLVETLNQLNSSSQNYIISIYFGCVGVGFSYPFIRAHALR